MITDKPPNLSTKNLRRRNKSNRSISTNWRTMKIRKDRKMRKSSWWCRNDKKKWKWKSRKKRGSEWCRRSWWPFTKATVPHVTNTAATNEKWLTSSENNSKVGDKRLFKVIHLIKPILICSRAKTLTYWVLWIWGLLLPMQNDSN